LYILLTQSDKYDRQPMMQQSTSHRMLSTLTVFVMDASLYRNHVVGLARVVQQRPPAMMPQPFSWRLCCLFLPAFCRSGLVHHLLLIPLLFAHLAPNLIHLWMHPFHSRHFLPVDLSSVHVSVILPNRPVLISRAVKTLFQF
jgi:hypothetical protein